MILCYAFYVILNINLQYTETNIKSIKQIAAWLYLKSETTGTKNKKQKYRIFLSLKFSFSSAYPFLTKIFQSNTFFVKPLNFRLWLAVFKFSQIFCLTCS